MIYVLHFDRPYKHAKHYTGYAQNKLTLKRRLEYHGTANGSRLMHVVRKAGITWKVALIREGDQTEERRLKNGGSASKYCPICKAMRRRV